MGRFLNADALVATGQGLLGNNMFAYCGNNPVCNADPTGEFLLTALIVGAIVGAVIGGVIGGTAAYNSAKSEGLSGAELLCETVSGVATGAAIGTVAGGFVGATGAVVAAYGVGSVAGTAMITCTATMAAKTTEVAVLQTMKSGSEGKNYWQITDDCIDAVFYNGGDIISSAVTKGGTTGGTYLANDIIKHKVVPLRFNTYLHSPGGKIVSYGFMAYAWGQTINSMVCDDPVARANERGYTLQ